MHFCYAILCILSFYTQIYTVLLQTWCLYGLKMAQNGQNMVPQNNIIKGKVLCMTELDSNIYAEP